LVPKIPLVGRLGLISRKKNWVGRELFIPFPLYGLGKISLKKLFGTKKLGNFLKLQNYQP